MKRKLFLAVALLLVSGSMSFVYAWGVWGHNHISKSAVLALPSEMGMFFYNHADFLVQESTVPDLRKYTMNDKAEGPRHYIDMEPYNFGVIANAPATLSDAMAKYGKDTLDKFGILPWHIEEMMVKLTNAFKHKNKTEILFLAGDLAHYIGDAQMPLHTSINHNGQLTGQVGIHAFWESQLPEMFGKDYNLYAGEAHYIADIPRATWDMIDSSHALIVPLLAMDVKTTGEIPADKQYQKGSDGKMKKNKFGASVHTDEYSAKYHQLLDGMVERQLKNGIRHTADFWYTAWVNAGKPDLSSLDDEELTDRNKSLYKKELSRWQKDGTVTGCSPDKEF
jgi:hypothetical protein